MKINPSYPYPVLYAENDDYKNSSFTVNIDVNHFFGDVKIRAAFHLQNEEIERLINKEQCVFTLHIECGQTSYRSIFTTMEKKLEVTIPAKSLRGKVTIHSFIVANEPIPQYTNASFNEFYQGLSFNLEKGNIVAIGEAVDVNLYEDPTELLNLPSIVKITKSLKNDYMEVDMYSDLIVIELPEYEYNEYAANANSGLKQTILTAVIVPALVYVFSRISVSNKEDLAGFTWYQVLEKIFADSGLRIEQVGTDSLPALRAVQMILRRPYKAFFEEINKFLMIRSEE